MGTRDHDQALLRICFWNLIRLKLRKFADGLRKMDDVLIQFDVQKGKDAILNQRHDEMVGIHQKMTAVETDVKKTVVKVKLLLKEYGQKKKEPLIETHEARSGYPVCVLIYLLL